MGSEGKFIFMSLNSDTCGSVYLFGFCFVRLWNIFDRILGNLHNFSRVLWKSILLATYHTATGNHRKSFSISIREVCFFHFRSLVNIVSHGKKYYLSINNIFFLSVRLSLPTHASHMLPISFRKKITELFFFLYFFCRSRGYS